MTTIVLAEDHHLVRQGLRALLEEEPDFKVVGEASDGEQAVKLTAELKPEVLVADLMMPHLTGLEVIRQVKQLSPETRVVIFSMHDNDAFVLEALKGGAVGYVLKHARSDHLISAVREAAAGRFYLSPPLSERAIKAYLEHPADVLSDPFYSLTARERDVLTLVAQGYTNIQIAAHLAISARTVETHRSNLMHKLGLHSQADLIRLALKKGLISPEDY